MCNVEIMNQTSYQIRNIEKLIENVLNLLKYEEETEVSIVFSDNKMIQELNLKYRNKDYPTDVLSFPAEMDHFLGDIVISLEKAKEQGEDFKKEVEMLLVHGLLHLLGYDHETNEEDYEKMMSLQNELLEKKSEDITIQ
ncbi:MAG TPA: rRNA maturation RNase YbeY [Spirochaetia bacterium]|nr:MAG: rRNA maturation RNase YbeY [Spirochaetes bacterium GWB1_36_13]HCL57592.1 rRNA maturation RNase YbeY [Spirochaetia bacterium]